jgi:hypothetical protein
VNAKTAGCRNGVTCPIFGHRPKRLISSSPLPLGAVEMQPWGHLAERRTQIADVAERMSQSGVNASPPPAQGFWPRGTAQVCEQLAMHDCVQLWDRPDCETSCTLEIWPPTDSTAPCAGCCSVPGALRSSP